MGLISMFGLFCFCIQYEQEPILIFIGGNASLHLIASFWRLMAPLQKPLLLKFPLPTMFDLKNLLLNILRLYRI